MNRPCRSSNVVPFTGQLTKRKFLYAKGAPCQVEAIEPVVNVSENAKIKPILTRF
jgi:hypothetical protein